MEPSPQSYEPRTEVEVIMKIQQYHDVYDRQNRNLQRNEETFGGRIMKKTFIEMKLFQVKPDRLEQFEAKIEEMSANQLKCEGCISLRYFKRFFTIDGIEPGEPPRELSRIVKCVKY